MEGVHVHSHAYRHLHGSGHLGPRIPHNHHDATHLEARRSTDDAPGPSRIAARSGCHPGDSSSLCEKPVGGSSLTIPITLAVVIPVVIAFCVLLYLHRRATKQHQKEDNDDRYKSMDFGLEEQKAASKGSKRKSALFGGGVTEKEIRPGHKGQLSMDDISLSSPYLLPAGLQQSRESLHSLAKTIHQNEDPYRHVQYANSEVGSLRSFGKAHDTGSTYTGKTYTSGDQSSSRAQSFEKRQNSLPTSIASRQNSLPSSPLASSPLAMAPPVFQAPPASAPPTKSEFRFRDNGPSGPQVSAVTYTEEPVDMPQMPEIQEPAPVARKGQPSRPMSGESFTPEQSFVAGMVRDRDSVALPATDLHHGAAGGLGIMGGPPTSALPPTPVETQQTPGRAHVMSDASDYTDQFQFNVEGDEDEEEHQERGRQMDRQAGTGNADGLVVLQKANNRLSVGLRPLPPNLESEDPEFRADRIRSFYKDYFDDSKGDKPPVPQLPKVQHPNTQPMQPQRAQYYEDYDSGYLGEAAFFDPDSNAFVMPYAEPVTRRAMTPPPSSRRPMPPRPRGPGGPHVPRGSLGGMSAGGMPRGRPSPGGPRPRAGSAMSAATWGPRPDSSASARMNGPAKPKKRMPPPAALSTLPTPSKLKDDSFAIMNAMDFAPPPTFKDQARGRSQSPMGERRPYAVDVPVSSPLVSAFDDIPALPSPHLLRKSGTFTALDFAPPKRFKDPETMSDAGSVHSMGSGISSRNLGAIRNGAGRVSRLPGDQIFTTAQQDEVLKPQWGMRP